MKCQLCRVEFSSLADEEPSKLRLRAEGGISQFGRGGGQREWSFKLCSDCLKHLTTYLHLPQAGGERRSK